MNTSGYTKQGLCFSSCNSTSQKNVNLNICKNSTRQSKYKAKRPTIAVPEQEGIKKSVSVDTLDSVTTDSSNSSQKDSSTDGGIPPMPLRKVKAIGEELSDLINEPTKFNSADSSAEQIEKKNAELVAFKSTGDKLVEATDKTMTKEEMKLRELAKVEEEWRKKSAEASSQDRYSTSKVENVYYQQKAMPKQEQSHDVTISSLAPTRQTNPEKEQAMLSLAADLKAAGGELRTSKDNEATNNVVANQQFKTLTRVRKFEKDGQVITETVQRIVDVSSEDFRLAAKKEQLHRKQALHEMKAIRREEQNQGAELMMKIRLQWDQLDEKFRQEEDEVKRRYESELETMARLHKREIERLELQQARDLQQELRKLKTDQEKNLKKFRDMLKEDQKVMKKDVDKLPKGQRKDEFRIRKENLDHHQANQERDFMSKQASECEDFHRRKIEEQRRIVFEKEMVSLNSKHELIRAWKSDEWEMEQRKIDNKHQLTKNQLKETFFLQRSQMANRHQKEIEQHERLYRMKEEDMRRRQELERRRLPKIQRAEMKNRVANFRRNLRQDKKRESIMIVGLSAAEKEKLREFEESERRRQQDELQKLIARHQAEETELKSASDMEQLELKQLQNEKRHMLIQSESEKLKERDERYANEIHDWRDNLVPRKRALEEEFMRQKEEQRQFYFQTSTPTAVSTNAASAQMDNNRCSPLAVGKTVTAPRSANAAAALY